MMHLKKRGFHMASRCPLCGEADEGLNHPSPNSLPFGLEVVGGPHLYPWLFLGLPLLGTRSVFGLVRVPY